MPGSTLPCPLCGGTLREEVGGCNSCPMHSGCAMLCCEHCGYSTVTPESVTVRFFKNLFTRRHKEGLASRIPGTTEG